MSGATIADRRSCRARATLNIRQVGRESESLAPRSAVTNATTLATAAALDGGRWVFSRGMLGPSALSSGDHEWNGHGVNDTSFGSFAFFIALLGLHDGGDDAPGRDPRLS